MKDKRGEGGIGEREQEKDRRRGDGERITGAEREGERGGETAIETDEGTKR